MHASVCVCVCVCVRVCVCVCGCWCGCGFRCVIQPWNVNMVLCIGRGGDSGGGGLEREWVLPYLNTLPCLNTLPYFK